MRVKSRREEWEGGVGGSGMVEARDALGVGEGVEISWSDERVR